MARYIDADALVEEIRKAQISLETNDDRMWNINKKYHKGLAWAHRLTLDAPTADVEEVKRGYVIEHEGHEDDYYCECSVCGTHEVCLEDKYCSECGVKFDGKEGINMTETKVYCDHCGKVLDYTKDYEDIVVEMNHEYVNVDLCEDCFDELFETIKIFCSGIIRAKHGT